MSELSRQSARDAKVIYSRVTIIDRGTLYVVENTGDFPTTVLEGMVEANVPQYTHNPPIVIVLESDFNKTRDRDLPIHEPTPLAAACYEALLDELDREPVPDAE